ncbi:MAG: hypothetical protein HY327_00835 [Chloroflexi bacterium]|nr:hypothetical protein [Chloroflexota bacterium]
MTLPQRLFQFIAARFHVPPDALAYFFASAHLGRGAETALPFPAELIPIGARLFMRGWLNQKFLPTNRDWILPFWATRQFDPNDPAFIPHGFNLYTLNYTHRDWTLIGNPAREREAIVDPRGLITPWFDGWSLDVWIEVDEKFCAPSRLPDAAIQQSLHENMPMVVTAFEAKGVRTRVEAFAGEDDQHEFVAAQIAVENPFPSPHRATLYVAIRPFNPEGVGLIHDIEYSEQNGVGYFLVNGAVGAQLRKPDGIALSRFRDGDGDVALALPALNGKTRVHCDAGLATAVAAYHFDFTEAGMKRVNVFMPLTHEAIDLDEPIQISFPDSLAARLQTISTWRAELQRGMQIRVPDLQLQNAFDANKGFLLALADGDSITPGPYTYHQFWFRDAAYMLNALDKLALHDEAARVIEKFPRRLQKDGYLAATEGEWDSNGAAIWTMVEHARLTGDVDLVARHYGSLLRMAAWINSKRQITKSQNPKAQRPANFGLLPSGPSAEHLGPADYFYWDDFWGLAGLRDAARAAEMLKETRDAGQLRANYEAFRADVDASLDGVATRLNRAAMPASPYRRLDSAMVGSLVALYPLRLFDAHDTRIIDTLAAIKEYAWKDDAFFNHVGHSAFGTYLTLHVAQCWLFQRDASAWKILQWVLQNASPTFTWAEGIHPATRGGAMGDGHHGWALADFLLAARNMLLFEEDDHLVITPALPMEWVAENNVIKVENAATFFGEANFTIAFGDHTATLALNAEWRAAPAYIEWNLPFTPREIGGDSAGYKLQGNRVRVPRGGRRVVALW